MKKKTQQQKKNKRDGMLSYFFGTKADAIGR